MKIRPHFVALIALALVLSASGAASTPDARRPGASAPNLPPQERYFETLVIAPGQSTGDVNCIFCSIIVRGTVDGDAVAVWGSVYLDGTVNGEVVALGGSVHLHPGSHVTDDATAIAGRVLRDNGATADADVTSLWYLFFPGQREFLTSGLLVFFLFQLGLVLLVLLILRPRRVDAIAAALRDRRWRTIFSGTLASFTVLFAISVSNLHGWLDDVVTVGLPVVLLFISVPGFAAISLLLGRRIRPASSLIVVALIGTLAVDAFSAIPLFGIVFALLFFVFAVGASLSSGFGFAAGRAATAVSAADASATS